MHAATRYDLDRRDEIPAEVHDNYPSLREYAILIGYCGSHAHGTHIPPEDPDSIDDIDLMSIVVPPVDHYLGLREYGHHGTHSGFIGRYDVLTYEAQKFIRLLAKGNPNVLSMLWLRHEDYLYIGKPGWLLIDHRDLFSTKACYHSFAGYAAGQLHRMTHNACEGYMGEKRKSLVERYGYDCKNAAHCIRLLLMGIEFLETGTLTVRRGEDAQILKAIKRGGWKLEWVKAYAEELFEQARQVFERSPLPEGMDPEREELINKLCVRVIRTALRL